MSSEDLEKYESEMELQLYREYRDVVGLFSHVVETERRFYRVLAVGAIGAIEVTVATDGFAMYGSELSRVRFEGCKIEFLNLRGATLRDVQFVDCQLVEADFGEARLTRVSFEGCRLVSPDFTKGTFKDVDLTGADLAGPRGKRTVKAGAFFVDLLQTAIAPDEILTEIRIPAPPPRSGASA